MILMPARHTNIYRAKEWFKVLQTTPRSQTAVMKLGPGQATGNEPEAHNASDQALLLIEGELAAEIAGVRSRMKAGDVVVIPPRTKHKFTNPGDVPAITFSVYSPPEYPPHVKG
jgi:mannose-6-phosphate isomerase-like protein (cupin superfamily)